MPEQKLYFTDTIPTDVAIHAAALRKACLEWPTIPAMPNLNTPNLGTYLNICLAVRKPSLLNKVETVDKNPPFPRAFGGDPGAIYGAGGASALLVGLLLLVLLVRRLKRKPQAATPAGSVSRPVAANAFGVNSRAVQELDAELNLDAR